MQTTGRPCCARRGMTLIELLVVIAMISIIVGITFGVFFSVKDQSNSVYCNSVLKEIGSALRQYRIDYGAYPPPLRIEQYATAAHDGAPVAYYSQLPGAVDLSLLKYGGAVQSLVGVRLLNHPPVCPRDDYPGQEGNVTGYSTYSARYNYFGYDNLGNLYSYWWVGDSPAGALETSAPLETRGDPLPAGIPTWETYPRLANPDAPDTTIVTRCPYHPQGGKPRSNVLRVGGDVVTVRDDEWLASDGVGIPFQYQPEGPGRP